MKDTYSWESPSSEETTTEKDAIVDNTNYMDYSRRLLDFCLDKGIRLQMEAFRRKKCCALQCLLQVAMYSLLYSLIEGFDRVFDIRWLSLFTARELSTLIYGDGGAFNWTQEELTKAFNVDGLRKDSHIFEFLVETLLSFTVEQRRQFVSFVTGCPNLPVGGISQLSPPLRVVGLVTENPYPMTRSCFNMLILPTSYSTCNEMREYMLAAISQQGFHCL